MDKCIQGFETELHVCSVVRNKARVERARNFFGITHVGDLTAVRDVGFGAKKGGELGGGTDTGVMSRHNPPKNCRQGAVNTNSAQSLNKWCSLDQEDYSHVLPPSAWSVIKDVITL